MLNVAKMAKEAKRHAVIMTVAKTAKKATAAASEAQPARIRAGQKGES
jgi:hypothetical protein